MKTSLKVVLVNHSDTLGGASVVTRRLMHALRKAGVDARMVVSSKTTDDEYVSQMCGRKTQKMLFLKEHLDIFVNNGFNRADMFKVSVASAGYDILKHPWVKQADVVCLNWINQGMLSFTSIERLAKAGKRLVWTMHDMWNLTGVCHHAHECRRYRQNCGNCQYIKHGGKDNDLSRRVWKEKKRLYDVADIHFVAVSNWLADKCRESSLLSNRPVSVIPNAFPTSDYATEASLSMLPSDIDFDKNIIIMGAARLDDPIKGIEYAVEAFNHLHDNYPDVARDCVAVLFGDIRDESILSRIRLPYRHLGRISDAKVLRNLYAASKVVLSTSLYETLPGTLIEGEAAGCVPVSFGMGGQPDIIDHKVNGYIADYKSAQSIAEGIVWAIGHAPSRQQQHQDVYQRFDADVVAQRYIELFDNLMCN